MTRRVLVAGVGNIFLGDDGFGVEVARQLEGVPMPEGVEVKDFGIRGVHLAYQLLDGYDMLILIDAMSRGDEPGTISVIEPDIDEGDASSASIGVDAHGMDPASMLRMMAGLGGQVEKVLVVGCEPLHLWEEIGLSAEVMGAVPQAIEVVLGLVAEACATVGAAKESKPRESNPLESKPPGSKEDGT